MTRKANRRDFMKLAARTACAGYAATRGTASVFAQSPCSRVCKIEPFDYSGVRLLDGMLKSQYDGARDFYLNIPNDNLLLGFRQRAGFAAPGRPLIGWYGGAPSGPASPNAPVISGEDTYNAFGQYISGMARMAKATNDAAIRDKASTLIAEWAKTIEPDGYFYYSRKPWTPHYIYEKTVCGLVDMCAYVDKNESAHHLERITAWAEKNLDRSRKIPLVDGVGFGADGTEWYTLSENLYRAYELTGDSRYKSFGDLWHYDNYWGMFNGKVALAPYGRHAYSHVNTLSSAAMTYKITEDPQYLATIVNAYKWLQGTQVYATGGFGPGEKLIAPDGSLGKELDTNGNTFETVCGSWAIFKLGRYLMTFTGEAKYGDWIEKAVYNGIGAALPIQPDGRNYYYSDYRMGGGRKIYNALWKWTCCSGTYPQAIADYHNVIYFRDRDGVYVNLFMPSEVSWNGMMLRQETDFPRAERSTLMVQTAPTAAVSVSVRIPGWCENASLRLNGGQQTIAGKAGTWATIHRRWSAGDRISIDLPMRLSYVPVDAQHPKRVAVVYGPVVMVKRKGKPAGDVLKSLRKNEATLSFETVKTTQEEFVPFYSLGRDEPYEMYFDLS
jgi:DUF1680 family protein